MSFFSRLFTRPLTFVEFISRDKLHGDIVHVVGAIRYVPEHGESFDIFRHAVIDLNTYAVTNGYKQRLDKFEFESEFTHNALNVMADKLGCDVQITIEGEDEDDADWTSDDYVPAPEPEINNLEDGCELPAFEIDGDNEPDRRKLPKICLLYRQATVGTGEFFSVELFRSGRGMGQHKLQGIADYARFILYLRTSNQILCTYRKENRTGTGGMGFYVLDSTTGELLHNGILK